MSSGITKRLIEQNRVKKQIQNYNQNWYMTEMAAK